MKRILALLGLMAIGFMLLAAPNPGMVAVAEQALPTTVAQPATTTSQPYDPDEILAADTATAAPATTAVETTTSTTEAISEPVAIAGDIVDSRWGSFQVEIVVADGVIVDIVTLQEPGDRRSQNINDTAIPIYTEEALAVQAADFDAISGATVTWEAWGESLETAIEQAEIA